MEDQEQGGSHYWAADRVHAGCFLAYLALPPLSGFTLLLDQASVVAAAPHQFLM